MKQETIEEYFLGKMKEVLLFGNDAQAIRFMEKYYHAKQEQERSYSEEEVKDIMSETWIRCVGNDGNDFKELRDKILEQFKNK